MPGPGSYDANKEKGHNDLPKWRYFCCHSVSKKGSIRVVASKICQALQALEDTRARKALYMFDYLEKTKRTDNIEKRGKVPSFL